MANSDPMAFATVTWAFGDTDSPPDTQAPARTTVLPPEERYADRGLIARGGMGEVRRVYDRLLDCEVAMKTLGVALIDNAAARRRFINEGTVTARLQHPGIVTVRDRGERYGRLWYTMTEVRGSTFRERLDSENVPKDEVRLRQWLTQLQRVSEAVAYAHGRGVTHRDLKPDNLMFGEFGEVLVMDWGLATELDDDLADEGKVIGTVLYMAPEQARGEAAWFGPWSDVYALGAMLHELLVGEPPVTGTPRDILAVHWRHAVSPFPRGTDGLPEELVSTVRAALVDDPLQRMSHAGELAAALESWLVGAERRGRALVALDSATALGPEIKALRRRAREHREAAAQVLDALPGHAPAAEKAPGWEHEDQAVEAERRAATLQGDWMQAVGAALELAPDLAEAHELLAEHHARELLLAEAQGRTVDCLHHEAMLRRHDRGRHAELLAPHGPVTLVTEPAGAQVVASRIVERGRRLVEETLGVIGTTPLHGHSLARGSWVLDVRHPDVLPVRVPLRIRRGQGWSGVAPDGSAPRPLRLPRREELSDDEVYVPAGWFQAGGDPDALESFPASDVWLDGFVVRRHPVTVGEYLAFLHDRLEQEGPQRVLELAPHDVEGLDGPMSSLRRSEDGSFALAPGSSPDLPATQVTWWAATAYAAWWAERTGQPWRLPHELEWEKAARGVDGRAYPWGTTGELSFANLYGSQAGAPGLTPVTAFEHDRSVYGVCGLGGNVRDWCSNAFAKGEPLPQRPDVVAPTQGELRNIRGGSWSSTPRMSRCAIRYADPPDRTLTVVGFRLVRSFD